MYINTHCNYSQPTLIKLDNENIGGHLTPLQYSVAFPTAVIGPFSELNSYSTPTFTPVRC